MKLQIENFRGIKKGEVNLGKLNILIGSNNSGKTTILESLFLLPNPLRYVPYVSTTPHLMSAVEVLSHVHETSGSRAFISLFYNYSSSIAKISYTQDPMHVMTCFQRIGDSAEIYVLDDRLYYVGLIRISSTHIEHLGRVQLAVYDDRRKVFTRQPAYIDRNIPSQYFVSKVGEALYFHPLTIKFMWDYLKINWVKLRSTGLPSRIAKHVAESVGGDYDDLLLEPFIGGQQAIYVRTRDGRGIRLGDLGDGVQVSLTLMLMYEFIKPKILLIDDIESHMNPYLLMHVTSWLRKVLDSGTMVVLTTHSLEATKVISHALIDYNPQITLLSLRDGILKSKNLSIDEVEELERKGLDVRVMEGILI